MKTSNRRSWAALIATCAGLSPVAVCSAMDLGVASLGATGGLHIPSAQVLGPGELSLSLGNDQDPKLGEYRFRRNYSVGIGAGSGLEFVGRLVDYQNPQWLTDRGPGVFDANGPRDLSGNLKWQLPLPGRSWPAVAIGITDLGGGAVYFRSMYAVASGEEGPLRWTVGYARAGDASRSRVLDGLFGGAELRLLDTRSTVLLETNGVARHAGLRYYSPPLPWLGQGQVVGSVQRSFGATDLAGRAADAVSFNLSLVLALNASDKSRDQRVRSLIARAPQKPLAPLSRDAPALGPAADAAQLTALMAALQAGGFDAFRVGLSGAELVVEYETHRFLRNQVDELGLVLGLAVEHAPDDLLRVQVVGLKSGLPVVRLSSGVEPYRAWLRDESEAGAVRASLRFQSPGDFDPAGVRWIEGPSGTRTRLRVALKPLLNYAVGTEVGVFEHSLAVQARGQLPLWKGAQAYADLVQRLGQSNEMQPGGLFAASMHRSGIQTIALQQSWWLSPRVFATAGAGRYDYDAVGAEGESIIFLPWREDSLHLRGRVFRRSDRQMNGVQDAGSASYRWRITPDTWAEGGMHRYTDGSFGPSLALTRWFGDVALQVVARQGGDNRFVGVEFSLPLTPRQGMAAAPIQWVGAARFGLGLRTLLTSQTNTGNWIRPDSVRPVDLGFKPESELLNSGRLSPDYLRSQLPRLREAFYLYGRDSVQ